MNDKIICYSKRCTYNGAYGGPGIPYCTKYDASPSCSRRMSLEEYEDSKDREVGLIRCKNCKYFICEGVCDAGIIDSDGRPTEDDYCSLAEEVEDGTNSR